MTLFKAGDRLRLSYFRHDNVDGFPRTLTYSRFGTFVNKNAKGVVVYPDSSSLFVGTEFWPFESADPTYSRIVIELVEEAEA